MSGHADTISAESIRRVLRGQWANEEARQKALVATDALLAENQRLREALEVGLICMCDSCVERNKALLEQFGTEGVRDPSRGERARSASADVRVAGSPSGEVGADSEALAGDTESCPYCGEKKSAHAFASPTTCVLATEVPDPPVAGDTE